jgi:hypothetical protein
MSELSKDSKLVKCPFFKGQDTLKLFCEGIQPNSSIILSFISRGEKDAYRIRYCQQCYRYCKVYYLNDTKYDDNGNLK